MADGRASDERSTRARMSAICASSNTSETLDKGICTYKGEANLEVLIDVGKNSGLL